MHFIADRTPHRITEVATRLCYPVGNVYSFLFFIVYVHYYFGVMIEHCVCIIHFAFIIILLHINTVLICKFSQFMAFSSQCKICWSVYMKRPGLWVSMCTFIHEPKLCKRWFVCVRWNLQARCIIMANLDRRIDRNANEEYNGLKLCAERNVLYIYCKFGLGYKITNVKLPYLVFINMQWS